MRMRSLSPFKIPNFLRRLFAEGAFSQAFVPVLTEVRERGSHDEVKALVNRVAGVLGGSLLLLTSLAMIMAPWVALLFAPGFSRDAAKLALTADLIVWTFPYLLLISLTGFCGAILNTYGRFAVPAYTPVLLNLSLITAALVWAPGHA
jgi:putative peptidoglycan lipid II flippase